MTHEERILWKVAQDSKPNDPAPLYALADYLRSSDVEDDNELAYALEWMGVHGKRPRSAIDSWSSKVVWTWDTVYSHTGKFPKGYSKLPYIVRQCGVHYISLRTFREAVKYLAKGLAKGRRIFGLKGRSLP